MYLVRPEESTLCRALTESATAYVGGTAKEKAIKQRAQQAVPPRARGTAKGGWYRQGRGAVPPGSFLVFPGIHRKPKKSSWRYRLIVGGTAVNLLAVPPCWLKVLLGC